VKAIFFDAGGTLIQPWPSVGQVYSDVGRQYGIDASAAEMERAFRQAWQRATPRRTSEKEWWRHLVREALATLDLETNDDYFEALYEAFAQAAAWRVYPDVADALRLSRSRGLHVGLISNWDTRLRPLLDRMGLRQHFDSLTISCEVGAEKPDPKIFQAALSAAGVEPAVACHVGDSLEEDLRGAEAVGMRAVLVNRAAGKGLAALADELA
jgi:putative hydrolase of the HAD superfamily